MARPSAQNSGPPPKTTPIGGKNFQPDAMNPDLWPVFNDEGRRMINARIRPENTRLMGGGLDAFNLVNSPYGKSIGLGYKQAESAVQGMRQGMTDPNRALFGMNPYAAQASVQPQGPNPDQMRWAQAFANAQQAPAGLAVPNQMGGNSLLGAVGLNPLTGAGQSPSSFKGFSGAPTQTAPPTNFSRAALIEGAKKSGEFADIMNAYNRNAQGTGYRMDKNGNINPLSKSADDQGTSPFAREVYGPRAQDIATRRDFARGEAPVQQTTVNGMPALTKMNPYGTAIRQDLPASTGVRQGMMPDPLTGKMVPMRQWAADQSAVQATKLGSNTAQAGQDYFNPQAIQKSLSAQMAQAPQAKKFAPMQKPPIDTAQGLRPMQPSMAPLNSTPIVATNTLSSPAETINPFRGLAAANPLNANDAKSFRAKVGSSSQKKKSPPQSKTPLSDWVLNSPLGKVFSVTAK